MADSMHMSETKAMRKTFVVFRCDRCGALSYGSPEQIDGTEERRPPEGNVCGCYMGPRWVRGEWTPVTAPTRSHASEDE